MAKKIVAKPATDDTPDPDALYPVIKRGAGRPRKDPPSTTGTQVPTPPKAAKPVKVKAEKVPKPAKEPKAKKVKPAPAPQVTEAGSIGEMLDAKVRAPMEGEDLDTYTENLCKTSRNNQVEANLVRIKMGLSLLADAPKARQGVTEWQDAHAKRLGIEPRQFRNIMAAAKAIKPVLGKALPIAVNVALDVPLAKIPAAIKDAKEGRNPNAEKAKAAKPAVGAVDRIKAEIDRIRLQYTKATPEEQAEIRNALANLFGEIQTAS